MFQAHAVLIPLLSHVRSSANNLQEAMGYHEHCPLSLTIIMAAIVQVKYC